MREERPRRAVLRDVRTCPAAETGEDAYVLSPEHLAALYCVADDPVFRERCVVGSGAPEKTTETADLLVRPRDDNIVRGVACKQREFTVSEACALVRALGIRCTFCCGTTLTFPERLAALSCEVKAANADPSPSYVEFGEDVVPEQIPNQDVIAYTAFHTTDPAHSDSKVYAPVYDLRRPPTVHRRRLAHASALSSGPGCMIGGTCHHSDDEKTARLLRAPAALRTVRAHRPKKAARAPPCRWSFTAASVPTRPQLQLQLQQRRGRRRGAPPRATCFGEEPVAWSWTSSFARVTRPQR